jgi:hypothetical protein
MRGGELSVSIYPGLCDGRADSTLIGIRERRKNEGSAENPPKGRFVSGVHYVAAKAATHREFRAQRQNPNLFCINRRKDSARRES